MKERQTKEFYDFGAFRLDLENRLLWRGSETVALTPKEFELLLTFVENAGRVLSKDDLLEKIWADTFVEESTLARNISWLRKKLGANGGNIGEKFIETVPKRGYRFLLAVTKSNGSALVVEEQTLTHIRVEETISLPETPAETNDLVLKEKEENSGEEKIYELPPADRSRELQIGGERRAAGDWKLPRLVWLGVGLVAVAIAFLVYQSYFRQREPTAILATRVVPFSGLKGRESYPAFSPDGKQIAFAWDGGDREYLDIHIRLVGAGESVRLTRGTETHSINPVFSPDGKRIAFSRSTPEATEIFVVPALGGAERRICAVHSGASSFAWSPDGKTLAVPDSDDAARPATGIFLIAVETGEKRRLTAPPDNLIDSTPRFSPDGKQIAFLRVTNINEMDLYVVSAENGEKTARRITFDRAKINGLAWNAANDHIVFASTRGASSSLHLWQILAAGGEPEPLVTGAKNPGNPAIAPDGKLMAFVEESNDTNIHRIETRSNSERRANEIEFIASTRADHSPQVSPDGKRIVFVTERSGREEIWTANADGANQQSIAASGGSPRFSPDGKFVAFDAQTNGNSDVFIVPAEGGAPRRLTADNSNEFLPAWSADGQWIYFCSDRSGGNQLWKIPVTGEGEAKQITRNGAFESFAAPSGREIFYTKESGVAGLWRVAIDGGEETPVSELAEAAYRRSWTLVGDGIYYVAYSPHPPYKINFYNFKNGQVEAVASTLKTPIATYPGLAAAPDGKFLLYAEYDQNASSIMLAELGN